MSCGGYCEGSVDFAAVVAAPLVPTIISISRLVRAIGVRKRLCMLAEHLTSRQ